MARLEEKERMRIRKLRLQGLIRDETDEDYFNSFNSRNYNPSKFVSQSYVRSFKNWHLCFLSIKQTIYFLFFEYI